MLVGLSEQITRRKEHISAVWIVVTAGQTSRLSEPLAALPRRDPFLVFAKGVRQLDFSDEINKPNPVDIGLDRLDSASDRRADVVCWIHADFESVERHPLPPDLFLPGQPEQPGRLGRGQEGSHARRDLIDAGSPPDDDGLDLILQTFVRKFLMNPHAIDDEPSSHAAAHVGSRR